MAEALGTAGLGDLTEYAGRSDPGAGWVIADGRSAPRTGVVVPGAPAGSADAFFAKACPIISNANVAISSATPATFTTPLDHGLKVGDSIILSGTLPAAFTADSVVYYVATVLSTTTFTLSATFANGTPGAGINNAGAATNGATVRGCPHGLPAISPGSNILLPDGRGRSIVAQDNMGTALGAAGRLAVTNTAQGRSDRDHAAGGFETVTLTTAESAVPAHGHGSPSQTSNSGTVSGNTTDPGADSSNSSGASADHGHNATHYFDDRGAHNHDIPTGGLALSGGNTTIQSCNGGSFPGWQSGNEHVGHSHYGGGATSGGGDGHGHSVPMTHTFSVAIPPLKINQQGPNAATLAHNNIHPHLMTNYIVRVY